MALLSACALALRQGEDAPRILRSLSEDDRRLKALAAPLLADLDAGRAMSQALFRRGFISAAERGLLAEAEAVGALAEVLPLLVEQRQIPQLSMGLWQHFPFWIALAVVGGGIWSHLLIEMVGVNAFRHIFYELAIDMPLLSTLALQLPPAHGWLVGALVLTAVVLLRWLLRLIPGYGSLRVLWGVGLERPRLQRELLVWARLQQRAQQHGVPFAPQLWRSSWRRYRLALRCSSRWPAAAGPALRNLDPSDLIGRLQAIGLLPAGRAVEDPALWERVIRAAVDEQATHYGRLRPYLFLVLVSLALGAFFEVVVRPIIEAVS
ncbi:MAG: hypothetical protein EA402_13780 [Planctomycetota bacterium]|nr:MAG: hypothetical protein EA402_13780 [Planctomycetota bacterium]